MDDYVEKMRPVYIATWRAVQRHLMPSNQRLEKCLARIEQDLQDPNSLRYHEEPEYWLLPFLFPFPFLLFYPAIRNVEAFGIAHSFLIWFGRDLPALTTEQWDFIRNRIQDLVSSVTVDSATGQAIVPQRFRDEIKAHFPALPPEADGQG